MNNYLLHISKDQERKEMRISDWLGNVQHPVKEEKLQTKSIDLVSHSTKQSLYTPNENLSVLIIKYYTREDGNSLAKEMASSYENGNLDNYFNKLDGELSVILIDAKRNRIVIYSDRFGLIPTYIYADASSVFISSNPKNIYLSKSEIQVRKESINCFVETGQLLGIHSWFEQVELIDSSIKLEIDIDTFTVQRDYYWTWEEVQRSDLSFEDSVNKLAETFEAAVSKRKSVSNNTTLLLSGGLDSRLILSCLDKGDIKYSSTFSKRKSEELEIAKSLALNKKIEHKHLELNKENWLENRLENIWNLDAGFSFMHDHVAPFKTNKVSEDEFVFNGFGGGILFAGNYIEEGNNPITEQKARKHWGEYWTETDLNSPYHNLNKIEPYFLNTRLRRFTCSGTRTLLPATPLLPFIDKDFITLLMSIDDNYRKDRKLFKSVALRLDKKLFTDFTYSQLGRPITADKTLKYRFKGYYHHFLQKIFGIESISYVDYKRWSEGLVKKRDRLLNNDSLINQYLAAPDLSFDSLNLEKFGRVLTVEIYLQQLFNNKYLTTQELKTAIS